MGESLSLCGCADFHRLQIPQRQPGAASSVQGLRNRDNRCYANAAMQCLTRLPPIEHLYLANPPTSPCSDPVSCYFRFFFRSQQDNLPDESAVTGLIHALNFSIGQRHDSYEFLQSLLLSLQSSVCEPNPSSLFQGYLVTTRYCDFCTSPLKTTQNCMGISLELPINKPKVQLADLLSDFFTSAPDFPLANCPICDQSLSPTQSLTLQPPPILLIHLKRMLLTAAGDMRKSLTLVQCPLSSLNLSAYSEWLAVYDLAAVISHERGHYTCQVYRPEFGLWLYCDDDRVWEIKTCRLSASAYVLIYTLNLST